MNTILKTALTLSLVLILFSCAEAAPRDATESSASSEPGVVVKVGKAIEHGARTAASWIEHGVKTAASGVERGAKAAASGIKHGAKAAAHGVEQGAKATENAASHVANKIDDSPPASSPTSSK
jgi:hypothetical protein